MKTKCTYKFSDETIKQVRSGASRTKRSMTNYLEVLVGADFKWHNKKPPLDGFDFYDNGIIKREIELYKRHKTKQK